MPRARITSFHSTLRLFPFGCSLSFVAILCVALCQGTHTSDERNSGDTVVTDKLQAGARILCHWATEEKNNQAKSLVPGAGTIRRVKNERKTIDIDFDEGFRQWNIPQDWVVPVPRDSSILGIDLTAMTLQYAMYDQEAREKLTRGRNVLALVYLYRKNGFEQQPIPGVQVTGAGVDTVNGWYDLVWWYDRNEVTELFSAEELRLGEGLQDGSPYYEKDDGCIIYLDRARGFLERREARRWWRIRTSDGLSRYLRYMPDDSEDPFPPSQEWVVYQHGHAPAPTLHVVQ